MDRPVLSLRELEMLAKVEVRRSEDDLQFIVKDPNQL